VIASAVAITAIATALAVAQFSQGCFMPTEDVDMTIADLTFVAFTFCNSLRLLAYIPQITKAVRDQSGAEAISFWTWGLFLASNVSAIAYAVENKADWTMASMFLGNALGCGTILLIAAWKRSLHRRRSKDCQPFTRRHRVDSRRSAPSHTLATECALREIKAITLIEDHGAAGDIPSDKLAAAGVTMFEARSICYGGRVDAALALYESILNLGPVVARKSR